MIALAIVVTWSIDTDPGNAVARPAAATDPSGAFRLRDSQWAALKLATIGQFTFRDERRTDGKIAINEETTTPVFSPFSGRVSRLIARPGDVVSRGTPLFAIEASEFVQGQNDLVTAVAGVEKAKSKLLLAQTIEKRQRELYSIRGGALKDLELAQSDLIGAQGDLRSAEIALAAVRNRLRILGRGEDEIAFLEKSDKIGAETIVAAPIAGTVVQRKVGLGQYITVGATDPIYTVGSLSTVWLVANVRESDAPRIAVGAEVEVTVPAHPGRTFKARLTYVAPALDPNTRRLPVRAEIANTDRELLPEMFASFRIIAGEGRSMPAVPQDAVIYEGANARVWVARPDDKAVVARDVELGASSDGLVEVRRGLAVGEIVVASGALFIDRAARRD